MKRIFKKVAFVLALAMVVTMLPARVAAAAESDGPQMYKTLKLYLGGDVTGSYEGQRYAKVWNKGDYEVQFGSDNTDVATVNQKGFVTAVSVGTANITATFTAEDGSVVNKTCVVTVKKNAVKAGLNTASTKLVSEEGIAVGETKQLTAVRKDADGNTVWKDRDVITDAVRFESSDTSIFTVTKTQGKVTGVKAGEATLYVWAVQSEGKDPVTGEYPATTEKKAYTVKVFDAGILSVKQVSLTTVALTCGNADTAAAIAKDPTKLSAVYLLGENQIQTFIKSAKVDTANEKIVNVELYAEMMKDTTYKFTYEDKTVSLIGADPDAVVSIQITTSMAVSEEPTPIKINFLDENGVIINGDMGLVSFSAPDSVDYFLYGNEIYFNAIGKQAVVTATYDRGYDESGKEYPKLTTTATIVSVASSTANNILGWAVAENNKPANELSYSTGTMSISVGDEKLRLYGKYNITLANGTEQARYTWSGDAPTEDGAVFEYTSTNDAVIMVDSDDGDLHAASAGSAQIIVKRVYSDTNKPVVGVCSINVAGSRTLANFTAQPSKNKLAVNTSGATDSVNVVITPTDQLGGTSVPYMKYTVKVVSSLPDGVAIKVAGASEVVLTNANKEAVLGPATNINGWQTGYSLTADAALEKITNVQLSITAQQESGSWKSITRVVSLQVKDVTKSTIATYSLDLGRAEIDMNIPSFGDNDGMNKFESKIELRGYDSQGFYKALLPMEAGREVPTSKGAYSYMVTKGNENKMNMVTNDVFSSVTVKDTVVTGSSVSTPSGIKVIDKGWNTGTYTVKVYQGVEVNHEIKGKVVAFKNIVVKDSTVATTATVNNTSITAANEDDLVLELADKISFFRAGSNITSKITIVEITGTSRSDSDRYYVDKLRVREEITTGNNELKGNYYEYDVYIGKVFYTR